MSSDLQWLLLRKNNSFIVKGFPETHTFSKESGNLRNLHSHKFSGLANSKTIDISATPSGVQITTLKTKAPANSFTKSRTTTTVRSRSGGRRALGVTASIMKRGYRPDLRTAALARTSALISSQKEPKPSPPKKTRGKKVQA